MSEHEFSEFRDLVIDQDGRPAGEIVDEIKSNLASPWSFERVSTLGGTRSHAFTYEPPNGPARHLFLSEYDAGYLKVVNVVPTKDAETNELTKAEYNEAIEDFDAKFVQSLGVPAQMSSSVATLSKWLSPSTEKKLQFFADAANKGDRGSHPNDRKRWYDAVIAGHENGDEIPDYKLAEWLESQGFDAAGARDLAAQWGRQRDVLAQYAGMG